MEEKKRVVPREVSYVRTDNFVMKVICKWYLRNRESMQRRPLVKVSFFEQRIGVAQAKNQFIV